MPDEQYDVAIIGAGPAGVTAAILLAQKGRSVVLIDRAAFPKEVMCSGWLNARSAPLLGELGVPVKPLLDRAFRDVTFYRADFSQSAKPTFEETPGYLIDRTQFDNTLVATAIEQGVMVVQGCEAVNVRLKESSVTVELADGRSVESRLLLLAAGRGSELVERVGVARSTEGRPIWTAQVAATLSSDIASAEPHVGLVLGLDPKGSFGLCCESPEWLSISVNWYGERGEAIPALFGLSRRAFEHGVVSLDLSGRTQTAEVIPSPASAALDMDSHVGKHTLVIGDAGGFVSASSNEGIYPAMWSAKIAVEVADSALRSVHSQDELMTFDSVWRMRMADYLRSPHTDIRFLLPLIFTNQPMADRMGAAFFSGENI